MATKLQIINRAAQKVGSNLLSSLSDTSKMAVQAIALYDSVRLAEQRRNPWRFSIRRAPLRAITTTTQLLTFATYAAGTTYAVGDAVKASDGQYYQSQAAANLGNDPTVDGTTKWSLYSGPDTCDTYDSGTSYYTGEFVVESGTVYLSLQSGNMDDPVAATGTWLTLTAQPTQTALSILYPIGAGPAEQDTTFNLFRLPYGFLREVPQDPLSPAPPRSWRYENDYIVAGDVGPIILRFGSNTQDASQFDPLFAEGLTCRIAFELCETMTNSAAKQQTLGAQYKTFMGEARTVNAIECGPVMPEEDDWITVKVNGSSSPFQYA